MRDLYEEYLNWLVAKINISSEFREEFLEDLTKYTDNELEEFMEKLEKHDLVVITELCWDKCKEGAKYDS